MKLALAMAAINARSSRLTVDKGQASVASYHPVGRAWTRETDVYPQLNVKEREQYPYERGGGERVLELEQVLAFSEGIGRGGGGVGGRGDAISGHASNNGACRRHAAC